MSSSAAKRWIAPSRRLTHPEMGHVLVRRDPRDGDFIGVCPFHGDCLEGLACGPAIHARWNCDLSSLPQDHPGRSIIAGYLGQLVTGIALLHGARLVLFPPRPPSLEELGTAIEDSLDLLADHPRHTSRALGMRLGVAACAATLGAWLAIGHGALLP